MSNVNIVLDEVFGNLDDIMKLSIDQQAEYSDQIIGYAVDNNNNEFIEKQIIACESVEEKDYHKFNSCAIGGLAYIATKNTQTIMAERARKILDKYTKWYKSKNN